MAQLFKQVLLKQETGAFERCWIQSERAKLGKRVIDEDTKIISEVIEVADSVMLEQAMIDINRRNPLRRVTDV